MPLTFDMPFEQLEHYRGINPKPDDFDSYWSDAIAEMREVDPQVELVPADFQTSFADCFHMYFTGVKGARVHAMLLRPKQLRDNHPALVVFHGYTGNAGSWIEQLPYVAQGFVVAALDCRGQGGLSEDVGGHAGTTQRGHIIRGLDGDPHNLLFRHIFLDTAQLAGLVMDFPEVNENRVGAMGGSQGGGLTIACSALEPRIKRAAPVFPFLTDYQRVWEMDQAKDAYTEIQTYFRYHDPLHEREKEVFTKLGYIDVQHLANRIQANVLMGVGLMDTVCPPSTQFAAYNKITSEKSLVIYPDYRHENLPGHNDRTFQFMIEL
ncbi:MAG: acetylxylan esterase [Aggregatilineales bacterium]